MATQIFVNLPVKDLNRSVGFFTKLGYTFNPKFTDENATCMIIGENIFAMLLVESYFKTFTSKAICDTKTSTEAIVALSCDSRVQVDEIFDKAVAAGASASKGADDYGFMYQRAFDDLDGHHWEYFYMDLDVPMSG